MTRTIKSLIMSNKKDNLLVSRKWQLQKVKNIVVRSKNNGNIKQNINLTTYRPWGYFTILKEGLSYKIKCITVFPGKKLSLQIHYYRNEFWMIVKGIAKVTLDNNESIVGFGESIFIKSGFKHRLENLGEFSLEVIELQFGKYLEEDDIVRLEDDFGRCII